MKEIGTAKINLLLKTLSPFTHMSGAEGNEAVIAREAIMFRGKKRMVPCISGNAIRHRMVRHYGAAYLIDALGINGKLTLEMAFYLFNGGNLHESSISDNTRKIADMQRLFPLFRLLGGALRNQIIGGSLIALRGSLICRENAEKIHHYLSDEYRIAFENVGLLKSSDDYITKYQYTRGDEARANVALLPDDAAEREGKSNLMLYAGEAVMQGALFHAGFILHNVSRLEVGALLHALQLWQNDGGILGGMSRIGHGLFDMKMMYTDLHDFFDEQIEPATLVEEYIAHVDKHKEECTSWLYDTFGDKKKK